MTAPISNAPQNYVGYMVEEEQVLENVPNDIVFTEEEIQAIDNDLADTETILNEPNNGYPNSPVQDVNQHSTVVDTHDPGTI